MFGLLRKVIISKVNMECESRHFTLEKAHMCACFVCSMFASFIINEKNRLCCVVLTNELLPSLVLFSPSYMLFFLSPQLCITRCHAPLVTSAVFVSMHVGEGT